MGNVLQAVLASDAFQSAAPLMVIVLVVWSLVQYSDRVAIALDRLLLALDRRAARKAALTAQTEEDRKHALDVLDSLTSLQPDSQLHRGDRRLHKKRRRTTNSSNSNLRRPDM